MSTFVELLAVRPLVLFGRHVQPGRVLHVQPLHARRLVAQGDAMVLCPQDACRIIAAGRAGFAA